VTFNYALSDLILPPTSLLVTTLVGVALAKRRRAVGLTLVVASQLLLAALCLPVVANALARSLEPPPVTSEQLKRAQAIVILAGGNNRGSPEWGGETVKTTTLQRLRYGAKLARETGLPILVTGGRPLGSRYAESELMSDVLTSEYRLGVRWIEAEAMTTGENALMAAKALKADGVKRVALVTDAIHMPRSQGLRTCRTRSHRVPDRLRRAAAFRRVSAGARGRCAAPVEHGAARMVFAVVLCLA
jgi:uncharacterized SAM-binding protein YcdF (DUF218 family)